MNLHVSSLRNLDPAIVQAALRELGDEKALALRYEWPFWAREAQLPPQGDWVTWLILAGRGFGKTRTGAETIRDWQATGAYGRFALVAEDAGDARDVMIEGESGILAISPPWDRPDFEPSKKRLTWRNGATATYYSSDDPESLRGPQFDAAWCDELAKWKYAQEAWDQLQFGLRLGHSPRQVVTTTPRPIPLMRELVDDNTTIVTSGSTYENRDNLAPSFFSKVIKKYEGTRLGRQELEAEILLDNPNALFQLHQIDSTRVHEFPRDGLARVVVAIDPPATANADSDECGIVVAGVTPDDHYFVLDDCSIQGVSPNKWASRAVSAYHSYMANSIVAEVNQGGDMVESVIRGVDDSVAIIKVRATRGKWLRAEPISGLYEQGRVHHVGAFYALEDQMCDFDPSNLARGKSPDRLDALVWALTELSDRSGNPRIREL